MPKTPNLYKLLLPLLLIIASTTKAQQFGGNPPSIKWNQVNSPAARVIFPVGMDSAAIRVANIIGAMNGAVGPTIGLKQRQVSIVLQNQTTISNGYVGLAPFRSEFFLTPEQNSFDLGSLRWADQLAVHEFRHVQQYNNFNVGFSKALRVLFGEGGQAFANELTIPNWFFEGDAVFNETYVTTQGRGRLPYFFNGYRALWAAGKDYSFMKLRNGSYLDFVPDHYPIGYMLVSYGRDKYGNDFWKNVTQSAAAFDGVFYPLPKAIKQYSGEDFAHFRADAFDHFKQQFGLKTVTKPSTLSKNRHFIANQEYPAYIDDQTLVYSKSTYNHNPAFVKNTGGKEEIIARRNYSPDNYFDYRDSKIVYASYRPDLRWNYRDYSELYVLDVATGEQKRITVGTKYFAPAFSDDGNSIVTVQADPNGQSKLVILDTDGHIRQSIPNPAHLFYTYPKFYRNKIVSAVRTTTGEMSIAEIDTLSGTPDYLLAFSKQPIAFPNIKGDILYFSATSGKNDVLFALSLTDKKLFRLQNDSLKSAIGNYAAAVANDKIAWVSFTAYGSQVHQTDSKQIHWEPIADNQLPGGLPDMGIAALGKGDAAGLLATVNNRQPAISKYPKAFHLLNFHSIFPTVSDPDYTLALEGENVLNTLQTELLYNYNRNEGYSEIGFGTVYGGLFPYLSAGANYLMNRNVYDYRRNAEVYYDETQWHAGIEIPLNFTKGRANTLMYFGSDVVYDLVNLPGPYISSNFTYLNNYLTFSTFGRQAKQNIYPHIGDKLSLNYKSAITNIYANQFLVVNNLYLPGLSTNHSLVVSGAFQQRDQNSNGGFPNDFPFARGYDTRNLYQMYKLGVNYHFPIIYPDAGVANSLYFLRIRGNLFYDYMQANDFYTGGSKFKGDFRSAGAEVYFDTSVWNQLPVTFGIRFSHLYDPNLFGAQTSNVIEFVLPVSIF